MNTRRGNNATASNDICGIDEEEISNRLEETPGRKARLLAGKEAAKVVRRFWPSDKNVQWATRCLSFVGKGFYALGQRVTSESTTQRTEKHQKAKNEQDYLNRRQRKRALKTYLQQNEKEIHELLQDSEFVMKDAKNRQKVMVEMKNYEARLRHGRSFPKQKKAKTEQCTAVKMEEMDLVTTSNKSNGILKAHTSDHHNKEVPKTVKTKAAHVKIIDLISSGFLKPGKDIVSVFYKNTTYIASLDSKGTIQYEGTTFTSPSAFSVHVKRLQTPNKGGDDGWKSVIISGQSLANWRSQYLTNITKSPSDKTTKSFLKITQQTEEAVDVEDFDFD